MAGVGIADKKCCLQNGIFACIDAVEQLPRVVSIRLILLIEGQQSSFCWELSSTSRSVREKSSYRRT